MEPGKILIVEDEAITAMDIQQRLIDLGYETPLITHSGENAIEIPGQHNIKLVLMDIALQGQMDGTEAAQIIGDKFSIPIVFLTSFKDDDTFKRAKKSGPYGFITKPFDTKALSNAIELALLKDELMRKVEEAEKRYRLLMRNARCGLVLHKYDGVILECNNYACSIFQIHIVGQFEMKIQDFLIESERKDFLNQYQWLQPVEISNETHDANRALIFHVKQESGETRDIEASSVCVNISENRHYLTAMSDVTERNNLQKQVILNDKLATIGTLATGIIHEINNPLTWMMMNLDLAKEKIESLVPEYKEQFEKLVGCTTTLEDLNAGAIRISKIVSSLKGFARVADSEFTKENIHNTIDDALYLLAAPIALKTRVEKQYANNIPDLYTNNGKMEQVFINIINNAIQALDKDNVKQNIIRISTSLANERIRIDISDNGKGISEKNLSRLFEPFFTTKPVGVGTGLGLSICQSIVTQLGGTITVESTAGQGATFSIFLPLLLPPSLGTNDGKK